MSTKCNHDKKCFQCVQEEIKELENKIKELKKLLPENSPIIINVPQTIFYPQIITPIYPLPVYPTFPRPIYGSVLNNNTLLC